MGVGTAADPNDSAVYTSWARSGRRAVHNPTLATRTSGSVGLLRNWRGRAVRTRLERARGGEVEVVAARLRLLTYRH